MNDQSTPAVRLPPLVFGNSSALTFDRVDDCTAFLERSPGRPSTFDAIGRNAGFGVRLRAVPLPRITLLAGSSTPKVVDHESPRATLVVPFGRCASVVRSGGREYRWSSPHHAFYIPAGHRAAAESTAGSFLRLDIEPEALAAVGTDSAGPTGPQPAAVELLRPRIVPVRHPRLDWLAQMRALCAGVDALGCDAATIVAAGLDDAILRSVALMLRPELAVPAPADSRAARSLALEPLLERMAAHLRDRITLSDLEAWSGRSARTIQLAFRRRLGVGPMQWLRDRRLDLIQARLRCGDDTTPIRQIARECGIHRPTTLLTEYVRRFGEMPSETRKAGRVVSRACMAKHGATGRASDAGGADDRASFPRNA